MHRTRRTSSSPQMRPGAAEAEPLGRGRAAGEAAQRPRRKPEAPEARLPAPVAAARPDPRVPLEESLGVMADAQRAGKVRHIGVSNFSVKSSRARKVAKIVSVQNRYSLDDRNEEDVLAHCEKLGIAFLPWYPLGAGSAVRASKIKARRERLGAAPAQVAIAWLGQIAGDAPIPGTRLARASRGEHGGGEDPALAKTWPSSADGSGAADSPRRPGRARRRGHGPQPRAPRAPAEATGGAPGAALHVAREAIWARLLVALAWFAWHGAYAWLIAALLATEIAITAFDELVENRIRVAPQNERVLHLPCHQRRTDRGVGALLDWRAERAGAPRLRRAFLGHHGVRRDSRVLVGARLRRMAQPAAC